MHTIKDCLLKIEVDIEAFKELLTIEEEFSCIKKAYFKKVLNCHPDKGGSDEEFQTVNQSFEILRALKNGSDIESFSSNFSKLTSLSDKSDIPPKSYAYYQEALDESIPSYRVELAKSDRSKCAVTTKIAKKCDANTLILKNEPRIGSISPVSGTYGRWAHIKCWRVPSKIWRGLPLPEEETSVEAFEAALSSMNDIHLAGFNELPKDDRLSLARHCMDRNNWANPKAKKSIQVKNGSDVLPIEGGQDTDDFKSGAVLSESKDALVSKSQKRSSDELADTKPTFELPIVCGDNAHFLQGKTVVLSGIFTDIGGGAGLSVGKDAIKKFVESVGGSCKSAISGKTDVLLIGEEPGEKKIENAAARNIKIIGYKELCDAIENNPAKGIEGIETTDPSSIENFSGGFLGGKARIGGGQKVRKIKGSVEEE